jgi:hypothetical protein
VLQRNPIKTYIQGSYANAQMARTMEDHPSGMFKIIDHIVDADCVVWTGGADINPAIYGENVLPGTYFSERRDADDLAAIKIARSKRCILIGSCRGAQLLNCTPNGGRLWQDVTGHAGTDHYVIDKVTGDKHLTNSTHHQMMIPGKKGVLVGYNNKAAAKENYATKWKRNDTSTGISEFEDDAEVVVYVDTKTLCFQGHPEYGHFDTTRYFYELLDRYPLKWAGVKL